MIKFKKVPCKNFHIFSTNFFIKNNQKIGETDESWVKFRNCQIVTIS